MLPIILLETAPGAAALFRAGRYTECLERVRDSTSPQDTLLRAQCLLRLHRFSEIIRMDSLAQMADIPKPYQYMAQATVASAFFRLGMDEPGQTALCAAYQSAEHANTPLAKPWVDYHAAFVRWSEGDLAQAEHLATPLSRMGGVLGAKALALLSWVEASREHYGKQIVLLRQAWDTLPLDQDVYSGALILRALAYLSCELFDRPLALFIERAYERIAWPPDLAFEQAETLRAIAWNYALEGRIVPAIRALRKLESAAKDPATQILVLTDRARICFGSGESAHYRAFLEEAYDISQRIEWKDATAEQRYGLLMLATLWSPEDPERARDILNAYQQVTVPASPALAWSNGDPRRRAAEHYAAGSVCRHLHQRTEAINHLRESFGIYKRVGYHWRATLCAYQLAQLGYDKGTMDAALIWVRAEFPHAWFTPLFSGEQSFRTDAIVSNLTRVPREILHLLLQGMSTREISQRMERDEKTIRNHISNILHAFGVKKQSDLLKACEERGLTWEKPGKLG